MQTAQPKRRKHALAIVDPNSGKDVVEEMEKETSASGGSSNRETPQPVRTFAFVFPALNHDK